MTLQQIIDRVSVGKHRGKVFIAKDYTIADLITDLKSAQIEECERLLCCARYDITMEGPRFMTWNRSALDRLRVEYEQQHPLQRDPT